MASYELTKVADVGPNPHQEKACRCEAESSPCEPVAAKHLYRNLTTHKKCPDEDKGQRPLVALVNLDSHVNSRTVEAR